MTKLHIDEVFPKESVYPLIVTFQNGYTTDDFKSKNCVLLQDQNTDEKTVATELAGLIYSGKEEKEDLGKTLILSRNKITGKVRLIEVGRVELKPVLKLSEKIESNEVDNSFLELSRKFGSKKHKKAAEQSEKLKVNVETVKEQMHNVTVNITEDQVDTSSYLKKDCDDFYIPPINREAEKPEQVYDLNQILTEEEYEKIYREFEEKDFESELHPWFLSMIGTRTLSNEHKVLALYANCLFKFYETNIREVVKKNYVACALSPTLNKIILKKFTTYVTGKRYRPLQFKDRAFCHSLVFILLINNLKYSLSDLHKHTKVSARTLMVKLRIIGASVVGLGDKKAVQLKLPLTSAAGARRQSAKF